MYKTFTICQPWLLLNGKFKGEVVKAICQEVDIDKIIFELPGPWIPKMTISDIYILQKWLIDNLGAEVYIANVEPSEILCLEAERTNLGTHMKF